MCGLIFKQLPMIWHWHTISDWRFQIQVLNKNQEMVRKKKCTKLKPPRKCIFHSACLFYFLSFHCKEVVPWFITCHHPPQLHTLFWKSFYLFFIQNNIMSGHVSQFCYMFYCKSIMFDLLLMCDGNVLKIIHHQKHCVF